MAITYDLHDYFGTAYNNVQLVLDPNLDRFGKPRPRVSTWANVGPGWPSSTEQRLVLVLCRLRPDVCADSLQDWLEQREDELEAICEGYEEEHVGGSWIGSWFDDAASLADALGDKIEQALVDHEIDSYWKAGDWFVDAPDIGDAEDCDTIQEWAESAHDEALDQGARLDLDETEETLRYYLEQRLEEIGQMDDEDLDDDDVRDLGICQRLLGPEGPRDDHHLGRKRAVSAEGWGS